MTDVVCYRDAYARQVEATVRAPGEATLVVLDRTLFYPGVHRVDAA